MKNFKVEANELLQRNELKSVFGGRVDEGSCAAHVPCDLPGEHDDSCEGGKTTRYISGES